MAGMKQQAPTTVPTPDPTERTIEQLLHEVATVRELLETKVEAVRVVIDTRLTASDKAIELLQKLTDKMPSFVKCEVDQLQTLHAEKFESVASQMSLQFAGIAKQFEERDKRTEQLSLADKTAINAALAAQEKQAIAQNESNTTAGNKMELNFAKLIEQTQTLLAVSTNNLDAKINDQKSRLDKGEGNISGRSDGIGMIGAFVLGAVAILGAGISLVALVNSLNGP